MSIRSLNIQTASPALLPCWKCGQEAIAYSYTAEGPSLRWLYAVKCRYSDCQKVEDCATETGATDNWNAIQTGAADHSEQPRDMVNHPPHYNGHPSGVECIEVTELLPFNLGNAFKYVFRHRAKNGREDLEKARWYLQRELERAPDGTADLNYQAGERVERIAQHESYPVGRLLVCIAHGGADLEEALRQLEHLLAA